MNSEMEGKPRPFCPSCNKRLITYRETKDDWERVYHRACYKRLIAIKEKERLAKYHMDCAKEQEMLDKDFPDGVDCW